MGNQKSRQGTYYDPTVNATLMDQNKHYKVYRNNLGEEFQQYMVEHKGSNDFQNRYDYRIRNSSPYLVDAYSAKSSQNAFGCASGETYEVVTERIPLRLHDLHNLSSHEAMNILNKALKGFQQIYRSQGVLLVKDSMIGINPQNRVRVWMNSNFAVNEIEEQPISYGMLPDMEKQSTMVDNIIELVNARASRQKPWSDFIEEKYKYGRLNFEQAIKLSEYSARKNNIHIGETYKQNQPAYKQNQPTYTHENRLSQLQTNRNTPSHQISQQIQQVESIVNSNNQQMPRNQPILVNTQANQNVQSSYLVQNHPVVHNQQVVQVHSQPTASISNIRNKIVNGGAQMPKVGAFSEFKTIPAGVIHPNSNFVPPMPVQVNRPQIAPMPSPQQIYRPPAHVFDPKPVLNSNQALPSTSINKSLDMRQTRAARSASEGKPIVTFGNRPPVNLVDNNFIPQRQMAAPTLFSQPTRVSASSPTQAISQLPKIINRSVEHTHNRAFAVVSTAPMPAPQTIQANVQISQRSRTKIMESPQGKNRPGQITNQQTFQPQHVDFRDAVVREQTIKRQVINTNQSFGLNQIYESKTVPENEVLTQHHNSSLVDKLVTVALPQPSPGKDQNQIRMSEMFGVTRSIEQSNPEKNSIIQQISELDSHDPKYATPAFSRTESQPNPDKPALGFHHSVSPMQEQENKLSSVVQSLNYDKQSKYQAEHEGQSHFGNPVHINLNLVASQDSSVGAEEIKPLSNANGQKNMVGFEEAIRQNASNIRMETSKVSIRNSSELKSMISYKDLRELLRSTRRPA